MTAMLQVENLHQEFRIGGSLLDRMKFTDGRLRFPDTRVKAVNGVSLTVNRGEVVALVGERRGTRDKRAVSAPATFRVTASRGFGTDDETVARQNPNPSWGFPPLPPAAHRAHIASHPTQPRAAAVAVGVADGANGVESTPGDASNEPTTVLAPSPPFTVFLASADSGAVKSNDTVTQLLRCLHCAGHPAGTNTISPRRSGTRHGANAAAPGSVGSANRANSPDARYREVPGGSPRRSRRR